MLLSLLLLAYLQERIPDGRENAQVAGYLDKAKRMDAFANQSNMMHDTQHFFATCASAILWGRMAQEPFLRAKVREKLPDFYGWLVKEFYPEGVSP